MSNITIKQFQLFKTDKDGIHLEEITPALKALLNYKPEGAAFKYDIQIKLSKAIDKALRDFSEQHKSLLDELSVKKKVKLRNKKEFETQSEIIDAKEKSKADKNFKYDPEDIIIEIDGVKVRGEKILGNNYDLSDKKEEFNKRFIDLLNVEIELNCYPLKLSRFDKEKSIPEELDFAVLEDYIIDDLQR